MKGRAVGRKVTMTKHPYDKDEIVFENVSFSYTPSNTQLALENVSLRIKRGEFVAIIGPNGSGKTTFLRLLNCTLKPNSGRIVVFGIDSKEKDRIQRMMGFMPQKEYISSGFPILVRDVIMMGLTARKGILSKITGSESERVKMSLKAVALDERFLHKKFDELSGGLRQRVLFARCLAVNPEILLLDEPFNGVDVPSQEVILRTILKMKGDVTVIMVTHNINPILHHIDRVILLKNRVIAEGSPDEVLTNENLKRAYGAEIPIIYCDEGYGHPIYDTH